MLLLPSLGWQEYPIPPAEGAVYKYRPSGEKKIHTALKPKAEGQYGTFYLLSFYWLSALEGQMWWTGRKWGQGEIRACQLGREVVGQHMYRGTFDGIKDKVEDVFLFLLRLRQAIETGTVL